MLMHCEESKNRQPSEMVCLDKHQCWSLKRWAKASRSSVVIECWCDSAHDQSMDGVRRRRDEETSVIRAFSAFFGSVEMEKHLTRLWPEIRPVSWSKRAGRAGIEPGNSR